MSLLGSALPGLSQVDIARIGRERDQGVARNDEELDTICWVARGTTVARKGNLMSSERDEIPQIHVQGPQIGLTVACEKVARR